MTQALARILSVLALIAVLLTSGTTADATGTAGAVYTLTNAASGNAVVAFSRSASGELAPAGTFATGGLGGGSGLGSQDAVITSDDGQWLYAVDAGSNDIATFRIRHDGLGLVGRTPSGGTRPISLTTNGDLVYVLNAVSNTITGFRASGGSLAPLPGSTRVLLGQGPAQVEFAPSGNVLVVTDKTTSTLETFVVDGDGVAGSARSFTSSGAVPFGFAFGHRDQLVVSEAGGAPAGLSAASSYRVANDGSLVAITRSAATTQAAACWVVVTNNGRYAFTGNAGGDSISAFAIDQDGSLELVSGQAAYAAAAHTTDLATSRDSRFLYALDNGTHMISGFRIGSDGSLTRVPGAIVPAASVGLASR